MAPHPAFSRVLSRSCVTRMMRNHPVAFNISCALLVVTLFAVLPASTQSLDLRLTTPQQEFGTAIGSDYFLATYTQLEAYWKKLDRESDRMQLVDIGRTTQGRTQWMAIISSPENLARLDRYREVSRRLALADGLSDEQARALAAEGKAVVWINGGLHADEVLSAQQLMETVYQLLSRSDPETTRLLRDVIVLVVHANPDGHELMSTWYMRQTEPSRRTLANAPHPYHAYIGHDNNRDFFLASQVETINMNRILYREWFPQIVYDHHQSGPAGTVMFAPPFRDPFNYQFDPLIPVSIDLIGAAMHTRFALEGKPGVTMRSGSTYSTWWNGGLRTTAYFHNQIGLLTETIGSPTPMDIPFVPDHQLPRADLPYPITPQRWHFRQSVDYSITANWAVLDVASRFRETLLFNSYRMGRNSIERGSRDTWTTSPRRLAAMKTAAGARGAVPPQAVAELRAPQFRDPRGYILPSDQPDFLTATKFVDALLKNGITVHRATSSFNVSGRTYAAGSFVVKTAQAFRPHVLDMFEVQEHPDDIPYPGGRPKPPYDVAGWTLALQMGVKFERVLDAFDGPFEKIAAITPPIGKVNGAARPAGYVVSHHQNDAFIAVNRLMKAGEDVYWPNDRTTGQPRGAGSMYVPAGPSTLAVLQRAAADIGLTFTGVTAPPRGDALKLRPVRVALWDRYGGSISSGWTRWMFEQYEFPFEVVYAQGFDAGNLASRFDVIVLPGGAELAREPGSESSSAEVPPEFRARTGRITVARTLPQLKQFVEDGGTLIAIGEAARIAGALGLPLTSALIETAADGTTRVLPRDRHYVPGSILRVRVDNTTPLAYGFEPAVDVFFDSNPVFRVAAGADDDVRRVAWFADPSPLRSGWALGQQYLEGGSVVLDVRLGQGRVLLLGPEVNFRGQPHATFKFLFNGIYYGSGTPAQLP
jgi:hypothetical protein